MGVAGVTNFADDAGEAGFAFGDVQGDFFVGFAAGAAVRGFAFVDVEFAAGRAPEAEVGLLGAFHEQDFVVVVEAVEERGDFVRQSHLCGRVKQNGGGDGN